MIIEDEVTVAVVDEAVPELLGDEAPAFDPVVDLPAEEAPPAAYKHPVEVPATNREALRAEFLAKSAAGRK